MVLEALAGAEKLTWQAQDRFEAEVARWDRVLSAGECYRLGLVRLVLQQPSVVVMDGFAGAIDPATQDLLADILAEHHTTWEVRLFAS
jgi:ABC-type uncharacterized transport system fused permease/ATPase subunit